MFWCGCKWLMGLGGSAALKNRANLPFRPLSGPLVRAWSTMRSMTPSDIVKAAQAQPTIKLSTAVAPLNASLAAEHAGWLKLCAELRKGLQRSYRALRRDSGETAADRATFVPPKEWTDWLKAAAHTAKGLLAEGRALEQRAGANDLSPEELAAELRVQIRVFLEDMPAPERVDLLLATLTPAERKQLLSMAH